MADTEDAVRRRTAVAEYRKKLLQHKELESRVRSGFSLFFFIDFPSLVIESEILYRFHFSIIILQIPSISVCA